LAAKAAAKAAAAAAKAGKGGGKGGGQCEGGGVEWGGGAGQVFLRLPPPGRPDYVENIWDVAAGALVLEEAGGAVTDAAGRPLDFGCGPKLLRNRGVVASAGPRLHQRVVAAVAAARPGSAAAGSPRAAGGGPAA
jgi:hypothetical protein